jgi:hypothetical protein
MKPSNEDSQCVVMFLAYLTSWFDKLPCVCTLCLHLQASVYLPVHKIAMIGCSNGLLWSQQDAEPAWSPKPSASCTSASMYTTGLSTWRDPHPIPKTHDHFSELNSNYYHTLLHDIVDWLWRGETMSQNCGHQQAYFSSPGWCVSMESHGDDDASWG